MPRAGTSQQTRGGVFGGCRAPASGASGLEQSLLWPARQRTATLDFALSFTRSSAFAAGLGVHAGTTSARNVPGFVFPTFFTTYNNAAPTGACRETTAGTPKDDPDEVGFYDGVTQSQQILGSTFTPERPPASITPAINLGAILAMAEGTAKENAVNAACQAVRSNATYCPPGKTCK
jgi:hypothetical protein